MNTDNVKWIASRAYRIVGDGSADDFKDMFVGISGPFKLTGSERLDVAISLGYGCVVQIGQDSSRRIVQGRDELEALFHGILSIDNHLSKMSEKFRILDKYGKEYSVKSDGLLAGPIGAEFIKDQQRRTSG